MELDQTIQNMLKNTGLTRAGGEAKQHGKDRDMSCGFGHLPARAPLANPYVPFQAENPERYSTQRALIRGTLFPGLDLPYLGMVNTEEKGDSGLAELQALAFAINELSLYLNTHGNDTEVIELMESYQDLYRKGAKEYQKKHGPLQQRNGAEDGKFLWSRGPWPWEYEANCVTED